MLPPSTIPSRTASANVASEHTFASSSSSSFPTSHQPSGSSNRPSAGPSTSTIRSFVYTDRAYIPHGVFAGRNMRFHLDVAQEPIHGRRKTEKDRRPLAHCPIVRLRVKECRRITDASPYNRERDDYEQGWEETEVDMSTIETSNFICAAELHEPPYAPSPTPARSSQTHVVDGRGSTSSRVANVHFPQRPPPAPLSVNPSRSVDGDVVMGGARRSSPEVEGGPSSARRIRTLQQEQHTYSSPNVLRRAHDAPGPTPPEVSHEIQESKEERRAKAWGRNLYGNSHVSGIRVPAPEGGLGMWFLFTDLSVRQEGSYTLHFRCFDITAVPLDSPYPSPPLVTTRSQDFKVYSPRNFPGIPKPTELAEHFNRLGFKLNTRKNERIADYTPATAPVRRPSPQPVQHHEVDGSSTTTGDHNTGSSSTLQGSGGQPGHANTGTTSSSSGTITDRSSTGESVMLSTGSGGGMPGMPGGLPDMDRRGSR